MALPAVCTLPPSERLTRGNDSLPALLHRAVERVDLSTGYRFRFSGQPGMLTQLAAAIAEERQCCRFLRFQMTLDDDLGPITLDVSGSGEAKAFLTDLLATRS
jgi:hypothetical protein